MRIRITLLLIIAAMIQISCTEKVSGISQNNTEYKESKDISKEDGVKEAPVKTIVSADNEEESPEMFYQLGSEAHNHGRYEEAIHYFTKCLKFDNKYPEAMGFRGISKLKSGDLKGACADWDKAKKAGYSASDDLIRDYCK